MDVGTIEKWQQILTFVTYLVTACAMFSIILEAQEYQAFLARLGSRSRYEDGLAWIARHIFRIGRHIPVSEGGRRWRDPPWEIWRRIKVLRLTGKL